MRAALRSTVGVLSALGILALGSGALAQLGDPCGRDTDCKGDRICVNGGCAFPDQAQAQPEPGFQPGPQPGPMEGAPPEEPPAMQPDPGVGAAPDQGDLQQFQEALAPYGNWYQTPEYGFVWMPNGVGPDWRPYTMGRWDYTAYGWTWVGDEPWAWGPYHYGRWTVYPGSGWVWVPGYTWGPAWVSWRFGDSYVGWTPLEPGWAYGAGWDPAYPVHYSRWCFVPYAGFYGGGPVYRWAVAPAVVATSIWVSTRPAGVVTEGGVTFVGPSVGRVERAGGHPVRPVVIEAVSRPGARAAGGIAFYAPRFHAAPHPFEPGRVVAPTVRLGVGGIVSASHVETQRFVASHPAYRPQPVIRPAGAFERPAPEGARPEPFQGPGFHPAAAPARAEPNRAGWPRPGPMRPAERPASEGGFHPAPSGGFRPEPRGGFHPGAPRPTFHPAPPPKRKRPDER